jgi:hypothetical protein
MHPEPKALNTVVPAAFPIVTEEKRKIPERAPMKELFLNNFLPNILLV